MNVKWLDEPEEKDYIASFDFLTLLMREGEAMSIVKKLQRCPVVTKKAKDIIRASELPLLSRDNMHVARCIQKSTQNQPLSPILVVRFDDRLVIADGYHRACACYWVSEDTKVRCKVC